MSARTMTILGAAVAAALAATLPAQAADRQQGNGGLGEALGGLFGQGAGDLFGNDEGDSRKKQAARLCRDYAQEKVRDNGGEDVRIERVLRADRDGDKVRLLADMSADYDHDRRRSRVQCEVDFAGHNEVTAFRLLDDDNDGNRGAALGGDDDARTQEAVRTCRYYAQKKIGANGGDDVRVDRVLKADNNGDQVRLLAEISADYGRDRRSAPVLCDVDFKGGRGVTEFRQLSEKESRDLGYDVGRSGRSGGDDSRTRQATRLCRERAADKVHDHGGNDVRIDRVIDSESDGDRVRLRADMSADYHGDRRAAEVECEVDFEGQNEVVAFRQVGDAGGGSFENLLRDLLGQQ